MYSAPLDVNLICSERNKTFYKKRGIHGCLCYVGTVMNEL